MKLMILVLLVALCPIQKALPSTVSADELVKRSDAAGILKIVKGERVLGGFSLTADVVENLKGLDMRRVTFFHPNHTFSERPNTIDKQYIVYLSLQGDRYTTLQEKLVVIELGRFAFGRPDTDKVLKNLKIKNSDLHTYGDLNWYSEMCGCRYENLCKRNNTLISTFFKNLKRKRTERGD